MYTAEDVKLLAKCGYLEARGEGMLGILAVMHCVFNRIGQPGFPKTLQNVILAPNQFSWTRPDNPQYGHEPPEDEIYQTCLILAEAVLSNDNTNNSHYYANESQVGAGWYRTNIIENILHPVTAVIGKHTFRL